MEILGREVRPAEGIQGLKLNMLPTKRQKVTCMINRVVRLTLMAVVLSATMVLPAAQGADKNSQEYAIKAAFLYNFAKFVEWPEEAFSDGQEVMTICVLGQDPFGSALESMKGKTIKGRKVRIWRSKRICDLKVCHILYISRSKEKDLARILAELRGSNVLTVGDMENFAGRGGIINFITVENKLRFEINIDAAQQSGLKVSSNLLKVAKKVTN